MSPSAVRVSRETVHRQVFGDRYGLAVRYAEILATDGVERGLIGSRESGRLWDRHLLNCAVIAPAVPPGAVVLDVGSGAGLPGLVLAIARPDLTIHLVEPLLRRATFLTEVVEALELADVQVVRSRAEDLRATLSGDVVTARAVAPLHRLAGWCLPLVRPGGSLLALKGARASAEVAGAAAGLPALGAASWAVELHGVGVVDPPVRLVRVVRSPRAPGPPAVGPRPSATQRMSRCATPPPPPSRS